MLSDYCSLFSIAVSIMLGQPTDQTTLPPGLLAGMSRVVVVVGGGLLDRGARHSAIPRSTKSKAVMSELRLERERGMWGQEGCRN